MADKTIKICPIPNNVKQEDVKNALGDAKANKIHIEKHIAFVELQGDDDLEVLQFSRPDNKFDQLEGATYEKVSSTFKWGSFGSDSSSIQQLKQQPEHFQKIQQAPMILGQPNSNNLITITNCDKTLIQNMTASQIKHNILSGVSSVNRVLKKGNKVIFELRDLADAQKLEAIFPGLKVPGLGGNAAIDIDQEPSPDFASQWQQQNNRETEIKSDKKSQNERCLHQNIMPKIQKLTSMQSDFLGQKENKSEKTESQYHDITEHSSQNVSTKNQIESGFILNQQPLSGQRQDINVQFQNETEQRKAREQQEKRTADQQFRRKRQELLKKKQEEERKQMERKKAEQQQRERKQKLEKERQQKERAQRQKQRIQKQRKQTQLREKKEKQEREAKERQEKLRLQRQKKQKEQKERKERQSADMERQRQQRERAQKQAEQQRKKQQHQKAQKQKQQKQAYQKSRLQQSIRLQKLLQQQQRKKRQSAPLPMPTQPQLQPQPPLTSTLSEQQRISNDFLLRQSIDRAKQKIDNFIASVPKERIEGLVGGTAERNIGVFWGLVVFVVFVLML